MDSNHEPLPAEFGLDNRVMKYFSKDRDSKWLPYLLAWVSYLVFLPVASMMIAKHKHAWPIYVVWPIWFLFFVPGYYAGLAFNKLRKIYFQYSSKRHNLYKNYQEYLVAHSQWIKVQSSLYEQHVAEQKRQAAEQRQQLKWWRALDGRQFEKELTTLLRRLGYDAMLTSYTADGGVDILIQDGHRKIIIQCKAHRRYISPAVIRELYGTMLHEKADEGWLVTTAGFHSGAREFARGKPIQLITIEDLLKKASNKDH